MPLRRIGAIIIFVRKKEFMSIGERRMERKKGMRKGLQYLVITTGSKKEVWI